MGAAALPVAATMQAGGGIYSAIAQGAAGKAQSDYYGYLAGTARRNKALALTAADADAAEIGAQAGQMTRLADERTRRTVGEQVAGVAAGGAGASSKTAEQLVADTMTKGDLDKQAIQYNAAVKMKAARIGAQTSALNYDTEAQGDDLAGANAIQASKRNQISTILGTAGSVSSNWYRNYLTG